MATDNSKSRVKFTNYAEQWKDGTTAAHVLIDQPDGTEAYAGRIDVHVDQDSGERTFKAFDLNGEEIFVPNKSLLVQEKQFIKHKELLIAQINEQKLRPTLGGTIDDIGEGTATASVSPSPIPSPYHAEQTADERRELRKIERKEKSKSKSRGR